MDAAAHETTPAAAADITPAVPTPAPEPATAAPEAEAAATAAAAVESETPVAAAPPQVVQPAVVKTPAERLRDVVDKNPLDFNSWVQLLTFVEADPTARLETVEETFDRFLGEFPLCFGYWNKYAQYELALASRLGADGAPLVDQETAAKKARAVYERGVAAVRYSVDMWVKYCEFLISTLQVPVDEARAALESAVTACGSDPMAGPLWDAYIALETASNDMARLNQVFKRIMHQPLSNVVEFWEKYNHFVLAQQLQTLATTDELTALAGDATDMDEGLLRVQVVNSVEAIKNRTVEGMRRRQAFEAGIDRSYFHVTPVSESALRNWHNYLDFEEASGDAARCEALYERCVIACANYEDFWLRYAVWQDATRGFEAANAVFARAANVFLKRRASIHLEYATFLETHGKVELARAAYERVLTEVAPALVEAVLRRCNFERRCGAFDEVKRCFDRALSTLTLQPDVLALVATAYATFLTKSICDTEQARAVFDAAVRKTTASVVLWLNYIHFETAVGGAGFVDRVAQLFQDAVADSSELSKDEKSDLWFQYVEFMEAHAPDVAAVRIALAGETAWKRKHALPRARTMKLLAFESSAQSAATVAYGGGSGFGVKRPRYDAPVAAAPVRAVPVPVVPTPPVAAVPAAAAYAQYYQGYQGYGAQTYPAVDASQTAMAAATAAAATPAYAQAYTQAQYAAYYQQQQQR